MEKKKPPGWEAFQVADEEFFKGYLKMNRDLIIMAVDSIHPINKKTPGLGGLRVTEVFLFKRVI